MNKKKLALRIAIYIFGVFAILLFSRPVEAQLQQFSQYYSSPTILSPSFTGLTPGSRVAMNYRDQWPGIPGTFVTYGLSYDQYFPKWRSGFGLLLMRDVAGDGNLSLTNVGILYSIDFKLKKFHVRPGVQFKYSQRGVDYPLLVFGDQISMNQQTGSFDISDFSSEVYKVQKIRYPDASTSLLAYNSKIWGGFTVDNLLRPNQSLLGLNSKIPMKVSVFAGSKFLLNTKRSSHYIEESITVSFLYKNQGNYDQMDLGVYWTNTPIVLGLYFRGIPFLMEMTKGYKNVDAVIVLVGYKMNRISIGYSYDITISELMGSTHGSHELSLIYEFNYDVQLKVKQRREPIACPRF